MSYLNMSGGIPNFTKAVISLWFRVPKASLVACAHAAAADTSDSPHLFGIIPLVTFGIPLTQPVVGQQQQTWDHWLQYDPFVTGMLLAEVPVISFTPVTSGSAYVDPSYMGVSISPDQTIVYVKGNFQTTAISTVTGEMVISGCTLHYVPGAAGVPDYSGATTTWEDHATPSGPQAYYFELPNTDVNSFGDRWHHLLVSCDLSGSVSTNSSGATIADCTSSYNRMWVALDDVNVNGYDAFPNFVGGSDLNATITDESYRIASAPSPPRGLPLAQLQPTEVTWSNGTVHLVSGEVPLQNPGEDNTTDTPMTCSISSAPVPCHPIGLPATADQVDHIFRVEMAEFQMWTGVMLDTSVTTNRRAFIDKDGKPVSPDKKASSTDPQSGSIEFMGRPPDVLLHKTGNWKAGNNTGRLQPDSGPDPYDFNPTGKIKTYKPDPSLHGPQSLGQK